MSWVLRGRDIVIFKCRAERMRNRIYSFKISLLGMVPTQHWISNCLKYFANVYLPIKSIFLTQINRVIRSNLYLSDICWSNDYNFMESLSIWSNVRAWLIIYRSSVTPCLLISFAHNWDKWDWQVTITW